MLDSKQVIENATFRWPFAMLIPKSRHVVGNDRPTALAECTDCLGFEIGKTKAGGQYEDSVLFRNTALNNIDVIDKVVL